MIMIITYLSTGKPTKQEDTVPKKSIGPKILNCEKLGKRYVSLLGKCYYVEGTEMNFRCGIFGFCLLSFPQNKRKMYKLRQLSWYNFSLVLRQKSNIPHPGWLKMGT